MFYCAVSRENKDDADDSCSQKRAAYRKLLLQVQQQQKQVFQLETAISHRQKALASASVKGTP